MSEPSRKKSHEMGWALLVLIVGLSVGGGWRYWKNRPVPLDLAHSSRPAHALNLQGAIKRGYVEKFEWHGDVLWLFATAKCLAVDSRKFQQAIAANALAVATGDKRDCRGVLIVDAATGKPVGQIYVDEP